MGFPFGSVPCIFLFSIEGEMIGYVVFSDVIKRFVYVRSGLGSSNKYFPCLKGRILALLSIGGKCLNA